MNCPRCGGGTYVVDSRTKEFGVYRRRECRVCGNRISTTETDSESFRRLMEKTIADLKGQFDEAIDNVNKQFCNSLNIKERIQNDEKAGIYRIGQDPANYRQVRGEK